MYRRRHERLKHPKTLPGDIHRLVWKLVAVLGGFFGLVEGDEHFVTAE